MRIFSGKKAIKGEISVPGDKSISHRAVMLGALADGEVKVENFLNSGDCLSTVTAMRGLGVEVLQSGKNELAVKGRGLKGLRRPAAGLYAGNSGTTMRLLSGMLSAQEFDTVLTGDESLSRRPMDRVILPLRKMGAEITGKDDRYPPLEIKGRKLKGAMHELPVASAQVKSCLLLAGLYADGTTTVAEPLLSRNHTELMLEYLGVKIRKAGNSLSLDGGQKLRAAGIRVPGDISSAAFFLVAACITKGSELLVREVGINPTRTGLFEVLSAMGAKIILENKKTINGEPVADVYAVGGPLKGAAIDAAMIPRLIDEIPVIAVAATQAEGETVISGAGELRVKETDRLAAVCSELRKLGAEAEEKSDGLVIRGPVTLKGGRVSSYGDHRMAMALRVAALVSEEEIIIDDVSCIDISFPGFMGKFDGLLGGH